MDGSGNVTIHSTYACDRSAPEPAGDDEAPEHTTAPPASPEELSSA